NVCCAGGVELFQQPAKTTNTSGTAIQYRRSLCEKCMFVLMGRKRWEYRSGNAVAKLLRAWRTLPGGRICENAQTRCAGFVILSLSIECACGQPAAAVYSRAELAIIPESLSRSVPAEIPKLFQHNYL